VEDFQDGCRKGNRTWRLKKGGAECNQGSNFVEKELVDLTLATGVKAVPGACE
jgi:hypothetical protein